MTAGSMLGGDVPIASRFLFEVDGKEIGVFRELRGLEVTLKTVEYAEGGQSGYTHKLPDGMQWANLVLRRGITDGDELFAWMRRSGGGGFAENGSKITRSTGAVTLLSSDRKRLRTWDFDGVYAVRWKGPDLSVDSSRFLEEELEVAHNGIRQRKP